MPFLNELGNEALSTGDPEAVVLFGLRDDGVRLLSNLLDRTADVQTIALAASFVCPGIVREDRRLIRWIEAYRSLLDTLQLYHPRAIFDISRSRRARTLADQARSSGRHADAKEVQKALRKAAPPQMVVRCQFCATNISPSAQSLAVVEGDRTAAGTTVSLKSQAMILSPARLDLTLPSVTVLRLSVLQQKFAFLLRLSPETGDTSPERRHRCVDLNRPELQTTYV